MPAPSLSVGVPDCSGQPTPARSFEDASHLRESRSPGTRGEWSPSAVHSRHWPSGWDISPSRATLTAPLLVEAAQVTSRTLPEWRSKYMQLTMRPGRKIAKVAMARKLAVGLFWMMRQGWDYQQVMKFGSHVEQPGNRDGVL